MAGAPMVLPRGPCPTLYLIPALYPPSVELPPRGCCSLAAVQTPPRLAVGTPASAPLPRTLARTLYRAYLMGRVPRSWGGLPAASSALCTTFRLPACTVAATSWAVLGTSGIPLVGRAPGTSELPLVGRAPGTFELTSVAVGPLVSRSPWGQACTAYAARTSSIDARMPCARSGSAPARRRRRPPGSYTHTVTRVRPCKLLRSTITMFAP
ncbi:unnamed protein product [Calypogeia fissa]